MISVSHSGVDGDSNILGYVAVSTGSKVSDLMGRVLDLLAFNV